MLYLTAVIIFILTLIIFYVLLSILNKDKLILEDRLEQIEFINKGPIDNLEKRSLSERVIQPLYNSLSNVYFKWTPSYKVDLLNKKLERAGVLRNNTAERWMFNKTLLIIVFSLLFGLLTYNLKSNIFTSLVIALMVVMLINTLYRFYLARRISLKKNAIRRDLPYTLDLITVSVEAGLSFDGAIAKVVDTIEGELSSEFAKTLKEMRMGIEKKIALKNMSQRCDLKELSMLITSLIQADELGVSLGRVLRIEAAGLRENIKQAAREKAMKAPVKMLFPLVIFIFPAIFVIILGPIIIRMSEVF
ncbi:type II secretion system F family protein [Vallitalea okinawensis]|uniref:type II secretion system F family protein n=1 Tax=Vallitalea okinawensis TaxID=2078660 RepID=UPI000CFC7272|nr:type II secretion system F family protein [Vallitalea okinawensis]